MSNKKFILIVFLSLSFSFSIAQEQDKKEIGTEAEKKSDTIKGPNYNIIFKEVDVSATPKNGIQDFRKRIATSFKLPEVEQKTLGSVTTRFVIWNDGSIRDVTVIKEEPTGLGLGAEAIRVVSNSGDWIPAQIDGKNVNQYYVLPLKFEISPTPKKKREVHKVNNIESKQ